jgi:hypothetical protein
MNARLVTTILAVVALAIPALAARGKTIEVTAVSASASHTQDNYTFSAEEIVDDRLYTFFVVGGQGGGLQQSVTFRFAGNVDIAGFEIWNGCQVDDDSFKARARVAKVNLKIGFGGDMVFDIADQPGKQVIRFDEPVTGNNVRMFFKGLHGGTSWDQITITEIRFFTADPESFVQGADASASSELGEGDYAPAYVVDGFIDTVWCEAIKEEGEEDTPERKRGEQPQQTAMEASRSFTIAAGGIGEWIKVDLGGRQSVQKIGIVIGDAYDQQSFELSSRPKVLAVQLSDGSRETWNLRDTMDWQYLDLGGRSIAWANFVVEDVMLGKRYNDTSIGEIRFFTE